MILTENAYLFVFAEYIIEKMEEGIPVWNRVPGSPLDTNFTVKGLDEGKRYRFRVSAVNPYGESEPLESASIQAKNPFGKQL